MKPLIQVRQISRNTKFTALFGTYDGGAFPQTRECYNEVGDFIKNVTKPRSEHFTTVITCYDADGHRFQ